ncbi:MAG: hypothetical protein MUO76_04025 [Anaerolineaceae bacterium]|nr:hypothetical protein [Anaerolineaceae bacterium]
MQFNVRFWYQPGNKGIGPYVAEEQEIVFVGDLEPEIFYGPPSNLVSIPCIPKNVNTTTEFKYGQYLDVTFKTLDLFEIDDDDVVIGMAQDVELYGYFKVLAPSMGQEDEQPCLFDLPGLCDENEPWIMHRRHFINVAEWGGLSGEMHCAGCLQMLFSGHYELHEMDVCQSTNKYGCLYEGQPTQYKYNNNTIRVFVQDGDALTPEVELIDYDHASEDDDICHVTEMTPSRNLEEWAAVQNETYSFYGHMTTSGRCNVEAVINAVTP